MPRLTIDGYATPRPSARISTVAAILDCDEGDVRRMLRTGELEGHGKGKRGKRVFLDSVASYQQAREIRPEDKKYNNSNTVARKSAASAAAFKEAERKARALGIL